MNKPRQHPDSLRQRVIAIFFLGLLLLAGVATVIGWVFDEWGRIQLGWIGQIFGPALTVAGFALVVWSVQVQYSLGEGTPAPMVATQRLVSSGPYANTRNPMTLGALLMYLGIGIWTSSAVVVALTLIVFSLLLVYIYIHETRELSERFGETYLEYKKHTPFLIPRFWNRQGQ
ncbi:MAG TPA: isoprenylcysteine carboxylmethyltransferase family protein [Anaerolineales bacterium]